MPFAPKDSTPKGKLPDKKRGVTTKGPGQKKSSVGPIDKRPGTGMGKGSADKPYR